MLGGEEVEGKHTDHVSWAVRLAKGILLKNLIIYSKNHMTSNPILIPVKGHTEKQTKMGINAPTVTSFCLHYSVKHRSNNVLNSTFYIPLGIPKAFLDMWLHIQVEHLRVAQMLSYSPAMLFYLVKVLV